MSTRHLAEVDASNWWAFASCQDVDSELFFPVGAVESPAYQAAVAPARAICATCPVAVRRECLTFALETKACGIFAGLDEAERANLARRARRNGEEVTHPAEECPWPSQQRGIDRHRNLGVDPCGPCAALDQANADRGVLHTRVLDLAARGMSNPQIARTVGIHRDSARRIIRNHEKAAS